MVHADLKSGPEKKRQRWLSMWPCIGKDPTQMAGQLFITKVSGRIVLRRLCMPQVYQSVQVQCTASFFLHFDPLFFIYLTINRFQVAVSVILISTAYYVVIW